MDNISSSRVTQKPDTLVDPNNFLPPGIINLRYIDPIDVDDDAVAPSEPSEPESPSGTGIDYSDIRVVTQTLRSDPAGRFVVDVVLQVPDRKGVTEWEVRLTKV